MTFNLFIKTGLFELSQSDCQHSCIKCFYVHDKKKKQGENETNLICVASYVFVYVPRDFNILAVYK